MDDIKNNINNYKGVMLCTRPNENIVSSKEQPFVSRVDPKEMLGINPVRKIRAIEPRKRLNPILRRHRLWLEDFKQKMREKKEVEEIKELQSREKFERIREQAQVNKSKTQEYNEEYLDVAQRKEDHHHVQQEQSPAGKNKEKSGKAVNKKKGNNYKPKWAFTEEQLKDEEEQDVDDLLAFTQNLDYDKYINDLEVKHMVAALKNRIDELKGKEDDKWKNDIVKEWNNERKQFLTNKVDLNLDDRSDCRSVASEARSVASERSQKSIQEIKSKMVSKEKEWDTISTTTKKNAVTLEERIAKHVADEILRNNKQFRHYHSNASVRRILEQEAQKHLEEARGLPAPDIVENKEYFTRKHVQDPSNLPYLHRNPAV